MKKIILLLVAASFMTGCFKDEDDENNNLSLQFKNEFAGESIDLETGTYVNSSDESLNISTLNYIISNIVLIDASGEEYIYPVEESYFLVRENDEASQKIVLNNLPFDTIKSIRFGVGVDQSNYPLNGVNNFVPTAEENNMLWSWSAGYIFFKMEGVFNSENSQDEPFLYHIGSHGETLDNYKEVTLSYENARAVSTVNIKFDVAKIFAGENEMSLEEKADIQVDPVYAPKVISNVQQAFSVTTE